ncbi:MAG: hypothetical protein E6R08_01130 [Nevskiaceae bacterium]|nr:MAG: hypothetical protein E6R08_01130 [Nevskiaceae bacterium]
MKEMESDVPKVTEKALAALKTLAIASRTNPMSAKALAWKLWPEKVRERGSSRGRGGLYRAAGAYCSKLQRLGLVGFYMDDLQRGYYLSPVGKRVVEEAKVVEAADHNGKGESPPTKALGMTESF